MRKLGSIQCLENLNFSGPDGQEQWIILFHGYGADAYDLRSLSEVIQTPKPVNWLFPQGILEVPIGPGWTGRAWWNIDIQGLQEAQMRGEPRDLGKEAPESLPKLREKVMDAIKQLKVPWNQIILGGFSQGAMLATDIFMNAPEAPKGLIIMSGALLNKEEMKVKAPNRKGSKFFQSHGSSDTVLSHKGAAQLETMLNQSGLQGRLMTFAGGHEIPMPVIAKMNEYLKSLG